MVRDVSAALDMTKRKRYPELGIWILEFLVLQARDVSTALDMTRGVNR
jgi:hypothetical protein